VSDNIEKRFETGDDEDNVFPEKLKIAIIKLLHKKGNTEEAQKYRP
jgi:hypothetical protein